MLGTVLTRLQLLATSAISNVTTLVTKKLSELLGVLSNLKTQLVDLCNNLLSLFAQQLQKLKVLLAQFTTLALSTKVALISVLAKLGELGLQLRTIAQQTFQLVTALFKKDK